jgi:hypothetical protein
VLPIGWSVFREGLVIVVWSARSKPSGMRIINDLGAVAASLRSGTRYARIALY